jgi:hypothetical protein
MQAGSVDLFSGCLTPFRFNRNAPAMDNDTRTGILSPRRRIIALLFACSIFCLPLPGHAEFDYAAGAELGYMKVNVSDEDFHPILANLYFDANHHSGLGAEVLAATGIRDDDASRVELDLSSHLAVFATYSVRGARVAATFGAGYGKTRIDASLRGGDYPGRTTYEGGAFLLRFTEGFRRWPDWQLSLGLSSLFYDSDIDLWSANVGLRYAF